MPAFSCNSHKGMVSGLSIDQLHDTTNKMAEKQNFAATFFTLFFTLLIDPSHQSHLMLKASLQYNVALAVFSSQLAR